MELPGGQSILLAERRAPGHACLAPQFDLLFASGGGGEIWPDPTSGRTAWGTTTHPADHEIWLSSTSAQTVSRRAYEETLKIFARVARQSDEPSLTPAALAADLRAQIARRFAASDARVLFAASASEARGLARAIADALLRRRIIEIATTPAEASGVELCDSDSCTSVIVELRDENGDPREQTDIDGDALQLSEAALESKNAILFHLLDTSKTGLSGVSRAVARAVERAAPGRTLALVDASEGRAYPNELRRDLANGMMVLVSGSHFSGGPPFSAALLLPDGIAEKIDALTPFETSRLRTRVNIGLALRWSAALAELSDYAAVEDELRHDCLEVFARKARAMAARHGFLTVESMLLDSGDDPMRDSIVTLIPLTPEGPRRALDYASAIHRALMQPCDCVAGDAICHIGRPVPVGERAALTVSASAATVNAVARRVALGLSFERAMQPVVRDLETLFRKWEALAG